MASIQVDDTYNYNETQNFVSKKTQLDIVLDKLNSSIEANDNNDVEQASSIKANTDAIANTNTALNNAIQDNNNVDSEQTRLINANIASINTIEEQHYVKPNDLVDYVKKDDINGVKEEAVESAKTWVTEQGYITGVDLSAYATEEYADNKSVEASASAKNWVEEQNYITGVDLSNYATTEYANNKAIEASGNAVNEIDGRGYITGVDLSAYATTRYVNNMAVEASGKAVTEIENKGYITGVDLSAYATEEYANNKAIEASASAKSWVEEQNYITGVDLSNYALSADVNSEIANAKAEAISSATQDLSGYVTAVNLASTLLNYQKVSEAENSHSELQMMINKVSKNENGLTEAMNLMLKKISDLEKQHVDMPTSIVVLNENLEGNYAPTNGELYMINSTVSGERVGSSNAKVAIDASATTIDNITITSEVTSTSGKPIYNVFEQNQTVSSVCETFEASNVVVSEPVLAHNVFNIYNFANDAVVTIKDCDFNLNVANSNILRVANYQNASGVTINFENVNWTYENAGTAEDSEDWDWAGLVLFQPAGNDVSYTEGNTEYIDTWVYNFKNCKYNGVLVDDNNFGNHNQVVIFYNIGKDKAISLQSAEINFYDEDGNEI